MTPDTLLPQIKKAVQIVEPRSRVLLYGSRVRGTSHSVSDWDILVLVEGGCSEALEQRIRRSIYEIEWSTGEVISVMVRSLKDWESDRTRTTPLYQAIVREAIQA